MKFFKKYFLSIFSISIIVLAINSCTQEKKGNEEQFKMTILSDKEYREFYDKFIKIKFFTDLNMVEKTLKMKPTSKGNVYKPSFFKSDSKKVGAQLEYHVNNFEFTLSFDRFDKLTGKTIIDLKTYKKIYDEYRKNTEAEKVR